MYNTNNPIYASGEYLLGFLLAAISILSIGLGFIWGLGDVARYFRLKSF
jgi:hypothetical protein